MRNKLLKYIMSELLFKSSVPIEGLLNFFFLDSSLFKSGHFELLQSSTA